MTIDQLEAATVIGNAHDDRGLLQAAHAIAIDHTLPLATRLRSLKQMDRIMGEDAEADELALIEYVTFVGEPYVKSAN